MNHELKIWPSHFRAVAEGRKTFELRKADRDYNPGDSLLLRAWDPHSETYTGDEIWVDVTYVHRGGRCGVMKSHEVLGIRLREVAK